MLFPTRFYEVGKIKLEKANHKHIQDIHGHELSGDWLEKAKQTISSPDIIKRGNEYDEKGNYVKNTFVFSKLFSDNKWFSIVVYPDRSKKKIPWIRTVYPREYKGKGEIMWEKTENEEQWQIKLPQ